MMLSIFFIIGIISCNYCKANPETSNSLSENIDIPIDLNEIILSDLGYVGNIQSDVFSLDHSGWTAQNITINFANITGKQDIRVIQDEMTPDKTAFFRTANDIQNAYTQPQEISQEINFSRNVYLYSAVMQFQYVDSTVDSLKSKSIGNSTFIELRNDIGNQPSKTNHITQTRLNDTWIINKGQTFENYSNYVNTFTTLLINASINSEIASNIPYWIVYNSTEDYGSLVRYGLWCYYNDMLGLRSMNRSISTGSGDASSLWVLKNGWTDSINWIHDGNYHPYLKLYYRIIDTMKPSEIAMNVTLPSSKIVSDGIEFNGTVSLFNINSKDSTIIKTESNESIQYNPYISGIFERHNSSVLSKASYVVNGDHVEWKINVTASNVLMPNVSSRNVSISLPENFYEYEIQNSTINVGNDEVTFVVYANSTNSVIKIDIPEKVRRGTQFEVIAYGNGIGNINVSIWYGNHLLDSKISIFNTPTLFTIGTDNEIGNYIITVEYKNGNTIGYKTKEFILYDTFYWMWVTIAIILASIFSIIIINRKHKRKEQLREIRLIRSDYKQFIRDQMSIRAVLIIHKESGCLLAEKICGMDIDKKTELISGFLSAIAKWGKEVKDDGGDESLHKIVFKEFSVHIERSEHIFIAVFSDTELTSKMMQTQLKSLIKRIEMENVDHLEHFNGVVDFFKYLPKLIENFIGLQFQGICRLDRKKLRSTDIPQELKKMIEDYDFENGNIDIMKLIDWITYERNLKDDTNIYFYIYQLMILDVFKTYA